jgi:DNA-binding response OmpR family regulator
MSQSGDRPVVLVADDEPMLLDILRTFLSQEGFDVLLAADGQEALTTYQAQRGQVAVVLLDVRLPPFGGEQVFEELRQVDPAARCCFMGGAISPEEETRLLAIGAAAVFAKPFRFDQLAATLRSVLAGG